MTSTSSKESVISRTFDTAHDGMGVGWTGTFERLEAYLAKVS